jgi:crotonobetainyl-CoA:carnitine CoA-transferase CaiB-like acyl-CoA transferase
MWQAYHIAGEMTAMSIVAALVYRLSTGLGQQLHTSVHEAVSKNTETDLPDWIFLGQAHRRLTCRHSMVSTTGPTLSITKDGRYLLPYRTYLKGKANAWDGTVALLKKYAMQADLDDPKYDTDYRDTPEATDRIAQKTDALVSRFLFARDLWREAWQHELPWAPVRRPEENASDEHWRSRGTVFDVYHPELGKPLNYVGAKWVTHGLDWPRGPRAPLVGEHTGEVTTQWLAGPVRHERVHSTPRSGRPPVISPHGKPFALSGIRVIDLSWMLASAGGGRFLSAMGAEVIKVEHVSRIDRMRFSLGACPSGGRAERDAADGPLATPAFDANPNRGGAFMEINAGKLGLSLDLKHPRGRQILEDLIRDADMVVEGFSPGTMERLGLGFDRLRKLNPAIIYVQQSGFGQFGRYGRARAYGPSAQAMTGISEMSGLPEPYPPAGIGYSYLDWFGAYNMALAMLAALYRRDTTGEGCYIDASQGDTGIYLSGTAVLDHCVNGRRWRRYGNRSPYKRAAPHGAYRTRGTDRWIAVSAFTDEQWRALAEVLGSPSWADDERFATLEGRLQNADDLDRLVDAATAGHEGYRLMELLQARGVPTGVCQTAQDRYERDPQLSHLQWLVELPQTEIGTWPIREHPVRFSATPTYIGGQLGRSGPNYGEDTDAILTGILGLTDAEVAELRHGNVI